MRIEGAIPTYLSMHDMHNSRDYALGDFGKKYGWETSLVEWQDKFEPALRSDQYLINRETAELTEEQIFQNAYTAFWKEYTAREEQGRGTVRPFHTSEPIKYTAEDVEFVGLVDLAKRGSNGLRLDLLYTMDGSDSDFGKLFDRALENMNLSDHNFWHLRRTEQTLNSFFINCEILRTPQTREWVDSAILFANRHDDDQIITLQRNEQGEHLNAKKGHALAGAVMILVHAQRYAQERMISFEEAWKACAGAAFMMMKHDEPESLQEALAGSMDARGLIGENLSKAFYGNQLDLATLSPSQLVSLLIEVKEKNGFTQDGSVFGLAPEFEREYVDQLFSLLNNQNALLPECKVNNPDGSANQKREALNIMTEASVAADVADMVTPPFPAIYRTLLTQYSKQRLFMSENTPRFREYVNEELKAARQQPLPEDATLEDYYVALILYGRGNTPSQYTVAGSNQDSDLRRLLFEFKQIMSGSDSPFARHTYIQEFNRVNAIRGILAVEEVGRHILKNDLSIIDASARKDAEQLIIKALRRKGEKENQIQFLAQKSRAVKGNNNSEGVMTQQMLNRFWKFAGKRLTLQQRTHLDTVISHTFTIAAQVKENIRAKKQLFPADGQEQIIFSESTTSQQLSFERIINKVLQHFIEQYGYEGIEEDVRMYGQQTHLQEPPWTLPYGTYASTAKTDKIRTIRKPRQQLVA